jgi:hypothetical protein
MKVVMESVVPKYLKFPVFSLGSGNLTCRIHEQIKGRLKPEVRSFLLSVFGKVETACVDVVAVLDHDAA